jgi:23S rRNA (uracil1939-C5)-methyltransferase
MTTLTLKLTDMAHGGYALGRDESGRPIFVPYAIPGETVTVALTNEKRSYAHARLVSVDVPSPDRVEPRCAHFGRCGGCHLQHIAYERQLALKQAVVADQLQRIGGFKEVNVRPVLPNPNPYEHSMTLALSPTEAGGLGLWSPAAGEVIPIAECSITVPSLVALLQDFDMELPELRKLTLRLGDDGGLLAAFEVEDVEPPELEVDFPISVAIVLPDETAASLIGDHYIVRTVKGRDFRVSPGCFFYPNQAGAAQVVDTVLAYADLQGTERVLEGYSGVGLLTAFLAQGAAELIAIEQNPDAVADSAVNLDQFDSIRLYQGEIEMILPALMETADVATNVATNVAIFHPPGSGLSRELLALLEKNPPRRLVYVNGELTMLARDGKQLARLGYRLVEVQPIDMAPQTFQVETVSLWLRDQ